MMHDMLAAKLHDATVTEANTGYTGSISIDRILLEKTGIREHELVHVWDITNGERLKTYAIPGNPGEICINGAAAKRIKVGDRIIVACFRLMDEKQIKSHVPVIIFLDRLNAIK